MRNRIISSSELTGRCEQLHVEECSGNGESADLQHPICLFGPERYEPRYAYPLIVWMHSCFSSERELECVMPTLSMQNYVACAPRGTICCDENNSTFRWGRSPASAAIAEELVFDAVETAQRNFSIHSNRVFLAGFGAGGSMAWRVALRYPQRFAGVISLCGDFPADCQSLTNIEAARLLPSLWMFGSESSRCGISQICNTLPLLHSAKLQVDIRQYPCGDELLSNMLTDANGWMMEHVTNQPSALNQLPEESFSRN
jgi:phospholipase/carboxylesterase